jgi:crotonobetainyl-CoA:carnitine CoA-transferase CaiB-like acyl-CoA transferase
LVQAVGGLKSVTGAPNRDPTKAGVAAGRRSAGIHALTRNLAALAHRNALGRASAST